MSKEEKNEGTRRYNAKEVEKRSKKNKKGKNKKEVKTGWLIFKRIILILFILGILLGLIAAGIIAGTFMGIFGDEFKLSKEDLVIASENSTIVDSQGNILAVLNGDEQRKIVSLSEMPAYLPKAFEAIEDERFRTHTGVDIKRTGKATLTYLLNRGDSSFGGSTITQQLVKNITKEDDKSWVRKVKEMAKAMQIEKLLSKDQILELYLNVIFVGGNGIHGVALGSEYYFNKDVSELDLAECAFLAGINHTPNSYNMFIAKEEDKEKIDTLIKKRTKTVLAKMKELGMIGEDEYKVAYDKVEAGLTFEQGTLINNSDYSYHTEAAIQQIIDQLVEEKGMTKEMAKTYLYSRGLTIYTTQDLAIQEIMEEEFNDPKYFNHTKKENGEATTSEAAMVVIDHTTGYVVGCVGELGEKSQTMGWNRATQGVKQTGSAMKPLSVIAPAIEAGIITAGSVYDDVPTKFPNWSVKNYDNSWRGLLNVRSTIEISHNIGPAQIIYELGVENSIKFLKQLGITTLGEEGPAISLGGLQYGVTPLEMAGAYAAIANDGLYIEPTFYSKVEDSQGNVVLEPNQRKEQVMNESNAYIVKSILTQPVISGTATYCAIPGIDVCAKTGTTDNDYDRWLCGFTPYYTAATWYGSDENAVVYYSGNPAGQIWDAVMTATHEGLDGARFNVPDDIIRVAICRDSGLLPCEYCSEDPRGSRVYTEVFVRGTAPTETCDCHVLADVCTETDLLANTGCTTQSKVFIDRKDRDTKTGWTSAPDAAYMVPDEICSEHTTLVTPTPSITPSPSPTASGSTNTSKPTTSPTVNPSATPVETDEPEPPTTKPEPTETIEPTDDPDPIESPTPKPTEEEEE